MIAAVLKSKSARFVRTGVLAATVALLGVTSASAEAK